VNLIKQSYINPKTGKTELAIACVERNSKKQIGFIPKSDIEPDILKIRQLTGLVKLHEASGTFHCELTSVQAPSSEEYKSVKALAEAKKMIMPAYDIRAFAQFKNWIAAFETAKCKNMHATA
jgi:hypothetical protein